MRKFAIVTANGSLYQNPKTRYVYNVNMLLTLILQQHIGKEIIKKQGIMFREPIFLETVRLVSDQDILKYGEF